jgi:hypothetical protein
MFVVRYFVLCFALFCVGCGSQAKPVSKSGTFTKIISSIHDPSLTRLGKLLESDSPKLAESLRRTRELLTPNREPLTSAELREAKSAIIAEIERRGL